MVHCPSAFLTWLVNATRTALRAVGTTPGPGPDDVQRRGVQTDRKRPTVPVSRVSLPWSTGKSGAPSGGWGPAGDLVPNGTGPIEHARRTEGYVPRDAPYFAMPF